MLCIAKLEHKLRPLMLRMLPASLNTSIYSAGRKSFIVSLSKLEMEPIAADFHPVKIAGVIFRNDLGNAAGLDKDGSLLEFNYRIGAGFAVVGTLLNAPHPGNITRAFGKDCNPWIPLGNSHSALNSLGLPSLGIQPALDNIKAFREKFQPKDFPIGISIMGHPAQSGQEKLDGILECLEKSLPLADFIEINESCPNVSHSADHSELENRLKAIAKVACRKGTPIFVKFASLTDPADTVRLLDEHGFDGIVLTNTQKDYQGLRPKLHKGDLKAFDYYTQKHQGGLSGEVIREFALEQVKNTRTAIDTAGSKLSLIHVGGISTREHIDESRPLAHLREWYTGLMEQVCTKDLRTVYNNMTI